MFHDDQHGTAIVITAGLRNACKLTARRLEDLKVVISGAGAAGAPGGPKAAFWQKAGEGRRYRRVAVRVSAMRCSARTGK